MEDAANEDTEEKTVKTPDEEEGEKKTAEGDDEKPRTKDRKKSDKDKKKSPKESPRKKREKTPVDLDKIVIKKIEKKQEDRTADEKVLGMV